MKYYLISYILYKGIKMLKTNYIMNQKFLVQYCLNNAKIFEIIEKKLKMLFELVEKNEITNLEFNPSIDNIVLLSFNNGNCKIYNLLNKNDFIFFESIDDCRILCSKFNYLNPNIIASMNINSSIIIWDVRQLSLLKIINSINNDKIVQFKWSFFSNHMIEIRTYNEIKLLDIESKDKIIAKYRQNKVKDFLFLNEILLLIFKSISILKINIKKNEIISETNLTNLYNINEDLIKFNYLSLISQGNNLLIYELSSFSVVKDIDFKIKDNFYFFYPSKNKVSYYSFYDEPDEIINSFTIELDINLEKNKNIDKDNIKNDFYIQFQKVISRYMSLLNFEENIDKDELIYDKNYMKIAEVIQFLNKVKNVNIFKRKEVVDYILNNIENDELKGELSINKFKKIAKFSYIIKINDMNQKKKEISKILTQINNLSLLKELYIEIAKLLSIDNTNVNLLIIYLLLIKSYENKLVEYFKEDNIQKYKEEIKYYEPCFSKEDYEELFGLNKQSEKDTVLLFIDKAYEIKNYQYNNIILEKFISEIKNDFPNFNQPIEFDCANEELKWHLIKVHIFSKFKNLKLEKSEQENLGRLRKGIIKIKENELLIKESIVNDKYKLATSVYLITNPCNSRDSSSQFICNLLLSTKNTKEKLEEKLNTKIKNIKEPLKYEGIEYKDCENLCLENLNNLNNDFTNEEKYNFYYLVDNFVKNQDDIKKFLKKILTKQTFKDAYNILFKDENYKFLDYRFLEEFIDKRLKFIPTRAFSTLAISDKLSLSTFILIKSRNIIISNSLSPLIFNLLKNILNTGCYVLIEEHEVFHLLDCMPYYENNCAISINTPRKRYYDGQAEGGEYLELLLFDKTFNEIYLNEALFILNEANYEKPLIQFKEDFKKLNPKDLKIQGVFSYFNDDLEKIEEDSLNFNDIYVNLKKKKK